MDQPKTGSNGCICGRYGQEITETFAHMLGQAIGTRLAGGRLVVGGDVRSSTPLLKASLAQGALSTGCQVYDVGTVPTPALAFAKDRLWADGAVMVTGSCGSSEENGFDITLGKLPASNIDICELRQVVQNKGPFASGAGMLQHHGILEPYVSFLVARFVPVPPLRVLVDGLNGCMGQLAASTLGFLGCAVMERNCDPLPDFGGQTPDPFLAENRTALSRAVLSRQAQLGVSYDGDGDTVLFAVEQGTILTPEQTLVLLAHALLPHQPGSQVVYDAGYAPFVADQVRRAGGKPISSATTTGEIRRAFLEQGAVLGADLQGHYMFRAMGGGDALYATLVMLRISAGYENTLESVIADWQCSP